MNEITEYVGCVISRAIPLHNRLEYLIIAEDKCVDYKKYIHLFALVRGHVKSDIMNELFTGMMATVQSYANSFGFLMKFIKLVWLLFETLLIQIFYISAHTNVRGEQSKYLSPQNTARGRSMLGKLLLAAESDS